MSDHEGVEPDPSIGHVLENFRALIDQPPGEHHVGQGVLRPRLLAPHLKRAARRLLRLIEQMTLLIGKGGHPVHVGDIGIAFHHFQGDAKHGRSVAAVELEILLRLDDHEIARKFIQRLVAKTQARRQIILGPRAQYRKVEPFPARRVQLSSLRGDEVFGRATRRFGRLEKHPQQTGVHVRDAAVGSRISRADDALGAGLVGQKTVDELIDGPQRRITSGARRISQKVLAHGSDDTLAGKISAGLATSGYEYAAP